MAVRREEIWVLAANRVMARALEMDRWMEVFAEHRVTLTPHLVSDLRFVASDNGLSILEGDGRELPAPRLSLCRLYERHAPRHLELMGSECHVSARMVDLCYDKALVAQLVASAGVPMIATEVIPALSSEHVAQGRLRGSVVLKHVSGRGGQGVELVRDEGELAYVVDRLMGEPVVAQPLVDPGHDVRVYVIGGEPRYAMERLGKPGDFRSNYSTGGTARPYPLTDELESYTCRVLAVLPDALPFGSVDFCFDEGTPVFCEVNANLGCHIPYEFGGFDLIGDYADWIREVCL